MEQVKLQEVLMPTDKKTMLEALKMEILVIERGGYNPSVHQPHDDPRIFRDSISCLNIGVSDDKKEHPCSSCFLIDFVPEKYKGSNDDPCHKIPLNKKGDTIESLLESGRRSEDVQQEVLQWLKDAVKKLEAELAAEKP
jgi:hypothetical protein